ncbi:MAG: hypothetical protein HC919_04105 [Oscillatoriales cyanobacterium SM2_2_1]|nr:hypothetical protein [Oscillatoriales cyanobacterium SM2_2_1]
MARQPLLLPPSQGTTFSLILPITLSTARVLLVECQGRTYGLISDTVERVLQPPLTQRVCFWDHEAIPIRALSELLVYHSPLAKGSPATDPSSALEQRQLLIVLSAHTQRLAIAVDRVIGEQETVISPLGTEITAPSYICGSGMAPSGQPYLILDGTILVEGLPLYANGME